jgi:CheY-like chemotaxis protein
MEPRGPDILVVDGDADLLRLMELLLGSEGYTVRTATTQESVDRALESRTPDLVITEVRLALAPPFAVLDRLHADPTTRDLPALVCTGAVDDLATGARRLHRPRTAALTKPFDIDQLLHCVRWLLRGGAQPDGLYAPVQDTEGD